MRQPHIHFSVIAALVIVIAITTTARADEWHTSGILYAPTWMATPSLTDIVRTSMLDTDYSNGSGDRRFEFDIRIGGPLIGLRYNFGT